jgi:hydrogenase maturation protease
MMRTLVLGIGNTLLSDEGAGVRALDYAKRHLPNRPGVNYLDGGTLGFSLAIWIEATDHLIVVDAAELGASAGTVRTFEGAEMDRFIGRPKRSVHEVSLGDLLSIGHLTDTLPQRRALIALQPQCLTWGCELSQPVMEALPLVVQAIAALIEKWRENDLQFVEYHQTTWPAFSGHTGEKVC